ncbi:hypothetical protein KIW84_046476 [Lathyrus oleraceus]|uniref:Uncharacterized protein n=1 Tax=Pisum sativum TaxID=3888 RepID=A0A9D4XNB1_PEA|nr:hypothetical protein KIW84_046476 [Pisum sativum]
MTTSLLSPHERIPSIAMLAVCIDHVTLVQFNIGPIDIYPVKQDRQIPSRTLMSLSMLRGVPINCLYGYPVTDNVGSAIKHSTLHLGSIVVSVLPEDSTGEINLSPLVGDTGIGDPFLAGDT